LQAALRPIPPETIEARTPGAPATGAGTRTDQTPLDVLPCGGAPPRFGFTVTKLSGCAVQRNRIRRRLKEALRLLNPLPARPGHDYVILARPEALGMPFMALQGELVRALGKIDIRINQPPTHQENDRGARAAGGADEARRQSSKGRKSKG